MKEDLKTIFYIGLGAISETNDKMKEVKDSLYDKGKELYEKGLIANKELKHNINEAMKEHVTFVNANTSKEDILKNINSLSEEDKASLIKELNKGVDSKNEERKGSKKSAQQY